MEVRIWKWWERKERGGESDEEKSVKEGGKELMNQQLLLFTGHLTSIYEYVVIYGTTLCQL